MENGKEIFGNWNKIIQKRKELKGIEQPDQVPEYIKEIYPEYKEYAHSAAMLTVLYEQQIGEEKSTTLVRVVEENLRFIR